MQGLPEIVTCCGEETRLRQVCQSNWRSSPVLVHQARISDPNQHLVGERGNERDLPVVEGFDRAATDEHVPDQRAFPQHRHAEARSEAAERLCLTQAVLRVGHTSGICTYFPTSWMRPTTLCRAGERWPSLRHRHIRRKAMAGGAVVTPSFARRICAMSACTNAWPVDQRPEHGLQLTLDRLMILAHRLLSSVVPPPRRWRSVSLTAARRRADFMMTSRLCSLPFRPRVAASTRAALLRPCQIILCALDFLLTVNSPLL